MSAAHAPLASLASLASDLERLARRRAGTKLGWYAHACAYILVNLFLAFLSSRHTHSWAVFPALGWGLGLLIHGAAVWLTMPGGNLYAQLLERERTALRNQQP